MTALTFGASKENVVVWRDGIPFAALHWQFALELGRAYQMGGRDPLDPTFERVVTFGDEARTVRNCEGRVIVLSNGIVIADFDGPAAIDVGNALIAAAHRAEEWAKHEQVIADQALMMRLGGPVSFSGNRDINSEAWKEAETDSTLRRNIPAPPSIRSKEKFGYPTVIKEITGDVRTALKKLLLN